MKTAALSSVPRIPGAEILPSPCHRKALSTASMHSGRPNSLLNIGAIKQQRAFSFHWSADKVNNVIAGFCFDRDFAASEDSGAGFASQSDSAVFANQPCAFANSDYRCFVFFQKLKNSFLLRFTHVPGIWVRVLKMRAYLKRDQT